MRYIQDLLDIMQPQSEQTAEAEFFKSRPLSALDGAVTFSFSYVDPHSKSYGRIMGSNIQASTLAIRTKQRLDIVVGKSRVRLPDGIMYIIDQVMTDYSQVPQQALRLWGAPVGAPRLLRLTQIEDAWGSDN